MAINRVNSINPKIKKNEIRKIRSFFLKLFPKKTPFLKNSSTNSKKSFSVHLYSTFLINFLIIKSNFWVLVSKIFRLKLVFFKFFQYILKLGNPFNRMSNQIIYKHTVKSYYTFKKSITLLTFILHHNIKFENLMYETIGFGTVY